ncbi:MAG: non-canonical purine NTP pyrophosphatase [Actinobacteria bacterium]|uniref:dITP/XTP pyrophosphatase n=1 Tax=freshwater metagenome TaxID=449393 RepID=A0A6J7E0I9_9ZZZZ|nr:non-canonical purine NTP pyrophosphatase [Actinomycetota bacterium]
MTDGQVCLVLATANAHKVKEFERLLPGVTVEPIGSTVVLPPETGDTYAENALGKARAAALATGNTAIADDSGIEVESLGGSPGIRSARFAGENATDEENLTLLEELVPPGEKLEYVCCIALVDPITGVEEIFEARCAGTMSGTRSGNRGFGYDPAFVPDELGSSLTMADLTDEQKDLISHRGKAARMLTAFLP